MGPFGAKNALGDRLRSRVVVAALLLFITVLGVLRQAILRIQRLSHMLTMCAWCRRVSVDGEWISIDQFLQQRKNTTSSTGVCPDCYGKRAADKPVAAAAARKQSVA